jgi:HEAT repeat protein
MRLLSDPDPVIRGNAARALGILKASGARSLLIAALHDDGDPTVRSAAAMALARIKGAGVGDALAAGLDVRNPRVVREFSALALGVLGDGAHAAKLRALLDGRQGEGLAGAAAISLGIMRDSAAAPALRRMWSSSRRDPAVRGYAVLALGMLGDSLTRAGVGDLARRPGSAHIRRTATMALGLFPRLKASRVVLGSLFEETDPYVRGAALHSLGAVPRDDPVGILLGIADSRGFTRQARHDALAALGVLARGGAPAGYLALLEELNYRTMPEPVREVTRLF